MPVTVANNPDFIGSVFGRLTIIGKHGLDKTQHLLVNCRCVCGKEVVVSWGHLRCGNTQSCGCIIADRCAKDMVGHRYGRLTVVERAGRNKKWRALWKCRCDCGGEIVLLGTSLRIGNTKSCGCLAHENSVRTVRGAISACTKPFSEAARNQLYYQYQKNAEKRALVWLVPMEETFRLFELPCEYCGRPPMQSTGKSTNNGSFVYSGIDRVDSTKGYTLDNVVPCCKWCNWIKGRTSLPQFYENIARIALRHPEILATVGG